VRSMVEEPSSWTVGQVARIAHVTVRTLHHYDAIGLLTPSERSSAGYRRYTAADLARLRDVLGYRELGFGLDEIATILDAPGADPVGHLRRQRELLTRRLARLEAMVAAVDHELEARQMGIRLTPEERFEVFGDDDPAQYADEARSRWGDTEAYRESQRRAASYGKDDWLRIRAEGGAIDARLAEVMASGAASDSPAAIDAAEAHRAHIDRWFYAISPQFHARMSRPRVDDPRYAQHFDRIAPGLAAFAHAAAVANAERAG